MIIVVLFSTFFSTFGGGLMIVVLFSTFFSGGLTIVVFLSMTFSGGVVFTRESQATRRHVEAARTMVYFIFFEWVAGGFSGVARLEKGLRTNSIPCEGLTSFR